MKNCILIFSVALMIASCSKKIIPDKPSLTSSNFRLDTLPESQINIPIVINLKPIYSLAETKVDTLFTSPNWPNDWVQSGCDTRYKYHFRRSPLQMKAVANVLNLGFTGYYRIIGSTRVCAGNTVVSPWTPPCRCGFDEPERRVSVNFQNRISIAPNYTAKLEIVRQEPQSLDKCEVCFWGQDITKDVINGLKEELDLAKGEIEKAYGVTDLKPKFQQVWDQLNSVYNIYGMGWLQINPKRMRINNLYANNDSLYIFLGLNARPKISFEKPTEVFTKLPDLGMASNQSGFNIFLDAELNYDSLSGIMNRQLKDMRLDLDKGPVKKHMIIKEASLWGADNEKLIIRIDFEGSEKGTAYFVGRPFYNKQTRTIEFNDLDFDLKTKNVLTGTAEWLFNRTIVNQLEKNTKFQLGSYIDSAIVTANQQLNRQIVPGIFSSGNIREISLVGIYPLREHLLIRSNAAGDLSVKVESINFSF